MHSSQCSRVQALLAEYTDNTLSGGSAWEVEKHLAACSGCSAQAREMKAMVQLLRVAPTRDTSDTFMASLHARLDTVDPALVPARSLGRRIYSWLMGGENAFISGRLPALSLGVAVVAIAIVWSSNRVIAPVAVNAAAGTNPEVHIAVASSANSPFSDPAADNLELRSGSQQAVHF